MEKGNTGGGWESAPTVGLLEGRILKRPFLVVRAGDDNTLFSKKKKKKIIYSIKREKSPAISPCPVSRVVIDGTYLRYFVGGGDRFFLGCQQIG